MVWRPTVMLLLENLALLLCLRSPQFTSDNDACWSYVRPRFARYSPPPPTSQTILNIETA